MSPGQRSGARAFYPLGLVFPSFLDRRRILASGRRVWVGEAIAQRRPQGDLDSAAASGTIVRRGRRHRTAPVAWPGKPD